MMRRISSQYDGRCGKCRAPFSVGQPIGYDKNGLPRQKAFCLSCAGLSDSVDAPISHVEQEAPESDYSPKHVQGPDAPAPKGLSLALNGLEAYIDARIAQTAPKGVDVETVSAIVHSVVHPRTVIEVRTEKSTIEVKDAHRQTTDLINCVQAMTKVGYGTLMVGMAGTAKSRSAEVAAKALGLKLYCMPIGPQTTQQDILGYLQPNGDLVRTMVREWFEFGGLLCVDEFDSGSSEVLVILGSLFSDAAYAGFPDGMVKRSVDVPTAYVATANTFGYGADDIYTGRSALDGATLDRFATIAWGVDPAIESVMADGETEWYAAVLAARAIVNKRRLQVLVTPRATLKGAALRKVGFTVKQCAEMTVLRGLADDAHEALVECFS
jgi:hypothetical protein